MAKRSNMIFDGVGYVNNIGKSKYWGVSTGKDSCQKDYWLVSIHPEGGVFRDKTMTFRALWDRPKEEDMARVAAMLYDRMSEYSTWGVVRVPSADKKYLMRVSIADGRITRSKATQTCQHPIHVFNNRLTLDDVLDVAACEMVVPQEKETKVKVKTNSQTRTFSEVVSDLSALDIGIQEAQTLLAILEGKVRGKSA